MAHTERLKKIGKINKYFFTTRLHIASVMQSIQNTYCYTIIETNKCRSPQFR